MARLYSRKKGKSGSKTPKTKKPSWMIYSDEEIEKLVIKLFKEETPPSRIGIILRDAYGIPKVKYNKSILKILKENDLKPALPEDLVALIKKSITIKKHLEANKKDMFSKRGLQLTQAKIRRLVKYYKSKKVLPKEWKYTEKESRLIV